MANNFVWGINKHRQHASGIKANNDAIERLESELNKLEDKLDEFKSVLASRYADPYQVSRAEQKLSETEQELIDKQNEIKRLMVQNGDLQQPIENTLNVMRVGLGVPAVAGGTYGYLSFKNNKQEG